jgi:hypothetical protein
LEGRVDALLVDESLLTVRGLAVLRRRRAGGRLRVVAFTPAALPDPGPLDGLPLDGLLHLAADDASILAVLCGPNGLRRPTGGDRVSPLLSGRQREVADMTLAGLPLKAMASELRCSIQTAMEKCGVQTLPDFVLHWNSRASRHGWADDATSVGLGDRSRAICAQAP